MDATHIQINKLTKKFTMKVTSCNLCLFSYVCMMDLVMQLYGDVMPL